MSVQLFGYVVQSLQASVEDKDWGNTKSFLRRHVSWKVFAI